MEISRLLFVEVWATQWKLACRPHLKADDLGDHLGSEAQLAEQSEKQTLGFLVCSITSRQQGQQKRPRWGGFERQEEKQKTDVLDAYERSILRRRECPVESCLAVESEDVARGTSSRLTAQEVEENEPGSRDKEYRHHFQGVLLMETENCSLGSFCSYKSCFNLFYTDGNDPAWRVWISGDSSEPEEREILRSISKMLFLLSNRKNNPS